MLDSGSTEKIREGVNIDMDGERRTERSCFGRSTSND